MSELRPVLYYQTNESLDFKIIMYFIISKSLISNNKTNKIKILPLLLSSLSFGLYFSENKSCDCCET